MKPIVKLIVAILLILCLANMPYGFYTLVRFVAAFAFAYFSYDYFKAGKSSLLLILCRFKMKSILYYLILFLSLSVILQSCRRSDRNRTREAATFETEDENCKLGSDGWSIEEIKCANTANNVEYLSAEEQKVILICNLARLDGEKFIKTYAKPYLGERSNEYIESLYSDLRKVKRVRMMVPDNRLYEAAAYHAKDMGATGKIGHTSSDGTSMQTRISRWYSNYKYIGECCDYGYDKALDIVMHLLVDEGVESLGHRKNILDPQFGKIGVSIQPHIVYRYNCVQDFAN